MEKNNFSIYTKFHLRFKETKLSNDINLPLLVTIWKKIIPKVFVGNSNLLFLPFRINLNVIVVSMRNLTCAQTNEEI